MFYFQFMGGLGNQLFQYATAFSISKSYSIPFKVYYEDAYPLAKRKLELNNYQLAIELVDKVEREQIIKLKQRINDKTPYCRANSPSGVFLERWEYHYDPGINMLQDKMLLIGYWQNEQYFKKYENEIREAFSLKISLGNGMLEKLKKIRDKESSVSLHVRRGDYTINQIHGLCPISYYHKAVDQIKERFNDPYIFIFSDDIQWVRKRLKLKNVKFDIIDPSVAFPHEDLFLMSACNHHIIANSSFSWWGAWLNPNNNKIVIAPSEWLRGKTGLPIVLNEWITL